MTSENVFRSMRDIDPQLILDAAPDMPQKKKSKTVWIKWTSIAASFILIISTVFWINDYQHKDVAPAYDMMTVSGRMYEIIPFEDSKLLQNKSYKDILAEHGLSYPVNENDLGSSLGTYTNGNNESYVVYDYKPYKGKSVLVVKKESQLQYALFCNLDNSNTIIMDDLLKLYGFEQSDDIQEFYVDNTDLSNEIALAIIQHEIEEASICDDLQDTDNAYVVKIKIKGSNTDTLIFDYYPEMNIISKSLTFYQVSTDLATLLDK